MRQRDRRETLDALKVRLAAHAEALALELLGVPTKRSAREWRWGSKGSVSVRFGGKRGPTFASFEAGISGSLLDLIAFALDCNFRAAVHWARRWLDGDQQTVRPPSAAQQKPFDVDGEADQRIAQAVAIFARGRPIPGTPVARYLEGRAVGDDWSPDVVRFVTQNDVAKFTGWTWWHWNAAVFPITNRVGEVRAVQLVALRNDGTAAPRWKKPGKIKSTRGVLAASVLRIAGDEEAPLLLAEGPETALSLSLATGYETWACLGSISRAPVTDVPISRPIIVCRDDDARDAPSRKRLRDAIQKWRGEGRAVMEAMPWQRARRDKSDFNDLLQNSGADAVRERIRLAQVASLLPTGLALPAAAQQLAKAVARSVAELLADAPSDDRVPAPFHVIRASLGLGKSEIALREVFGAIEAGHRVVYLVPTHVLAEGLATRARTMAESRDIDLDVRVWRGVARSDPNTREPMCRDVDGVEEARQALLRPEDTICVACAHRDECLYLAQASQRAHLWFAPRDVLFHPMPATMKGASLVVLDEGFASAGLIGLEGKPKVVAVDALRDAAVDGRGRDAASADLNAELTPKRARLSDALSEHDLGPLSKSALLRAGVTRDLARSAYDLEWRRKRYVKIERDMSRAEALAEIRRVGRVNADVGRNTMMWREIGTFLDDADAERAGRLYLVEQEDSEARTRYRAVRLSGVQCINADWAATPMLHLDATADMTLIRARVPHAQLRADIAAATPHMHLHQLVGKRWGKGALEQSPKAVAEAWRWALVTATFTGGRWLVVTNSAIERLIRAEHDVPSFMELAHFNALAGRDDFGGIRGLIVLGRPMPPPAAVERIAEAITGRAVDALPGWYQAELETVGAADGSVRSVEVDRHPHPIGEAVRWSICEGELLQAIGRGRGVRRDAATPLDVYLLGEVVLPLPVDELRDWVGTGLDGAMLAASGVWLENAADAARAFPGVIQSEGALRKARSIQTVTCPYRELLLRAGNTLESVRYQRSGPRQRAWHAVFDRRRVADIRTWLEDRLGTMAFVAKTGNVAA